MESLIRFILMLGIGGFLFWGCASKEYFKPLEVAGKKKMSGDLPSKMIDTSKYGATLKDKKVLTQEGLDFTLKKDEEFLTQTQGFYLVTKHCNTLLIYANDKSLKSSLEIPSCPVSATIKGNQVALIGNDNTAYVYDFLTQKELFIKKSNAALAVNSLLQAPIFFENYIFFPTLDGSVVVVNGKTFEVEKSMIVDSAPFFNNVIFLHVDKNLVLASTAKRILSVYGGNTFMLEEEVRDIQVQNNKIYISTLDGQIKELDFTLKTLRSLKFQFASIPVLSFSGNKIYAIEDGSGFLIEIDLSSFTPEIYKLSISRGKNVFLQKNRIYYEDQYLEF
ncbi:hypothetical protein [Helicobacter kayseriensis]|uniref:hypothetical protein n=1 Tax=Helicobacter kayseriensis TaxID=2905877 RepID=UPI001E3F005B|nr:hypothetical protein [Helicobacter kayseriensis]MCE3046767.1 hypothetical protein [Helicobacter kayseriensis]MCE3047931.1 hypothetical protein [Helicobacter kayseriensis]